MDTRENYFTWICLGPKVFSQSKLDRDLVNSVCLNKWALVACTTLPRHHLDHCPLLVHLAFIGAMIPRQFWFSATWVGHATFQQVVDSSWTSLIHTDNFVSQVLVKLNMLKVVLSLGVSFIWEIWVCVSLWHVMF